MADFNLTKMAVNMYCPGNVVELDDAGLPSVLVYIPAFKNSDVLTGGDNSTHPAFIVNGKEIPGFYYSKYQNVVHNGKAYSLPAEDPKTSVNFDTARNFCEDKGYGWHLSTAAEWAAIALWCKKNGFLPYGNNAYGKDIRESSNKAIATVKDANGRTNLVATGSGPLTWSHDQTPSGIWDMNGNGWEWQGGIRLVWGELQILANNDASDPDNPQNQTSTCWKAINAADGSLVKPECTTTDSAVKATGKTVKFNFANSVWTFSTGITSAENTDRSCKFSHVTCDNTISTAAKALLRALALLPDEDVAGYEGNIFQLNNSNPERLIQRSGIWHQSTISGVFSLFGYYPRTLNAEYLTFRSAYIPSLGE